MDIKDALFITLGGLAVIKFAIDIFKNKQKDVVEQSSQDATQNTNYNFY